jgi:hypothetical protein
MKAGNTFTGTVLLQDEVEQVIKFNFFQTLQTVMRARRLKEKKK